MSSPICHLAGSPLSSNGPSRSVLEKLLEEIDSNDKRPGLSRTDSFLYRSPASRAGSLSHPHHQAPSLWVGGSSAAQDARRKLRALDEARQRRQSSISLSIAPASTELLDQQISPQGYVEASTPFGTAQPTMSWSAFDDMQFDAVATRSNVDEPSPTSETSHSSMETKRERGWSGSSSPDVTLKRLRGGKPHSCSVSFVEQSVVRRVASFRPLDDAPQSLRYPSTPRRSFSPMDGSTSPATTPAWMKPFHLVDEEKSIYLNVHGEDWKDHALCLHCFRRHGNFHRMLPYGCEVCGQDEILKGHYWELPDRE